MDRKHFTSKTLKLALSETEFADLVKKYEGSLNRNFRNVREVNEKDLEILATYKSGTTKIRDLSEKFMITPSAVLTSLRIAALSKI